MRGGKKAHKARAAEFMAAHVKDINELLLRMPRWAQLRGILSGVLRCHVLGGHPRARTPACSLQR